MTPNSATSARMGLSVEALFRLQKLRPLTNLVTLGTFMPVNIPVGEEE